MELPAVDRFEMDLLLPQWELFDGQLEAVEAEIAERAEADHDAQLLESMPGMGPYSAVAVASRIGKIDRFRRPASLANYFGLTPGCRNSGDANQRLGSITKQGFIAESSKRNAMGTKRTRANQAARPHSSSSPGAALGSVPTVALSSAQVTQV